MTKIQNNLKAEGKQFYKEIDGLYELQPHHKKLLFLACQSLDEAKRLEADIKGNGYSFVDRYQQLKPRPESLALMKHKEFFAKIMRQLGLDLVEANGVPTVPLS